MVHGYRSILWALALTVLLLPGLPAQGESDDIAALKAQVEALTQRVEQLEGQLAEQKQVATPAPPPAQSPSPAPTPSARLSAGPDGFRLASADGLYRLRIGGQFGFDYAGFRQDRALKRALGDDQDGVGFRFIRLRLSGQLGPPIGYMFEVDFAGDRGDEVPTIKDMFIEYRDIPFIRDRSLAIQVGHFREPYSLEELGSTVETMFLDRSLANVFAPGRNPGFMIYGAAVGAPGAERLAYALGAFKDTDDWPGRGDSDEDRGFQVTGRVTGLPWYSQDGRRLLHLGIAHSVRDPDGATLRFSVRPESRLSLFRYIDTDRLAEGFRLRDAGADRIHLTGLEWAALWGAFNFQGEYHHAYVDTRRGSVNLDGYYLQAAYAITGEHRPYNHSRGALRGISPQNRFSFRHGGAGSWEAAVRWSAVSLNDRWLRAGEHESLSLGLNWYLNPNARIMANWTRNWIDHPRYRGDFDAYQTRFQLEF